MLIPTCVLRGISKVRKVGHRTQLFGLGFQLGEFFAQFVNHLLQRGTSQIRELLFAQVFPQMFCWIEFGTIGRLKDQADVLRHLQIFGMMPSRLIHLHHDKRVREGLGDMRKSRDSSWRYQLWAGSERSFSPLLE